SEAPKSLEPSAEAEAAASAQSNKLSVKNERDAADKPGRENGPVAARELPQEDKSPRRAPPAVSALPSVSGVEISTPNVISRDASSDTRPAEPPPSIQPAKREESPAPKIIRRSGDVLQNSAISRVRPVYPEAARSARVSGPVTVEVTVDEEGNVIAARAISGPDPLKDAAVNAARGWKWMPARVDRTRVKVVGTITLNFQR
ncbi:MAG TPA: TonB family protein, partial [Blastocatellia bacterium]|nr:TonB family protein [Blastocatellia bacterium]